MRKNSSGSKKPYYRMLRGYAFDPSMSLELETAGINEICYKIDWEDKLDPGPDGEYVKIIDRDPPSNAFYQPVDLNDPHILAQDGLSPSLSNPQFHQQMVYAVAMYTIKNFERAIGRKIQWSVSILDVTDEYIKDPKKINSKVRYHERKYIRQLFIYPHAFRGANAYYSPDRKAILFGYFEATPASPDLHMPGSIVFTCLSHDIITHEVTHAIIDGMFPKFMEITHIDVGAFHEAFSDIVALFQHFTFPEVINHELSRIKGNFNIETLLGKLAVEMGKASGEYGSLRDGIGSYDRFKKWKRNKPDLNAYRTILECHQRGSILVGSVFDAFISIYERRAAEIIKIATGGSGVLPTGELNTQLAKALSSEASKTANHILNMCIRALDYCPPIDITFGDYLRAIITADMDLVEDDKHNYRLAFIDSFRRRGIYPEGIANLSVESLTYRPDSEAKEFEEFTRIISPSLINFKNKMSYIKNRENIYRTTLRFMYGKKGFNLSSDEAVEGIGDLINETLTKNENKALLFERLTGLIFSKSFTQLNITESPYYPGRPHLNIIDIRLNNRVGPDGEIQNQVIIVLEQICGVRITPIIKNDDYEITTFSYNPIDNFGEGFLFRGSCTLVFDLNNSSENLTEDNYFQLKYVISKPLLDMELLNKPTPKYKINKKRAVMQYRCWYGDYSDASGIAETRNQVERFSYIHNSKIN